MKNVLFSRVGALVGALVLLAAPAAARAQAAGPTKRLTTATAVRMRAEPNTSATVVATLPIGTLLAPSARSVVRERVGEQEDYWYLAAAPDGKEGWVFGGFTRAVGAAGLDEEYAKIARERLARESMSFAELTDLVGFLERVAPGVSSRELRAELELARLVALGRSFYAVPFDRPSPDPYQAWIDAHAAEIVYSEPAGAWFVNSDAYWALHDRYKGTPVAERIAWAAAENPLPGECETDTACNLRYHALTTARYLALHPSGAHAKEAITRIGETVTVILDDMKGEGHAFDVPTEPEYRADLREAIAELRAALAKLSDPAARRVVAQLDEMRALMP